jgi:hypothetical protein
VIAEIRERHKKGIRELLREEKDIWDIKEEVRVFITAMLEILTF